MGELDETSDMLEVFEELAVGRRLNDLRHGVFLNAVAVSGWASAGITAISALFLDGLPFRESESRGGGGNDVGRHDSNY